MTHGLKDTECCCVEDLYSIVEAVSQATKLLAEYVESGACTAEDVDWQRVVSDTQSALAEALAGFCKNHGDVDVQHKSAAAHWLTHRVMG